MHIHFDTRRASPSISHLTETLCYEALARRPDLSGRVRLTFGWDNEGVEDALTTANVLVGFRIPRDLVARGAPHLRLIHIIGAGVEHLTPFDWVPDGVTITNNRGVHEQKAIEFITLSLLLLNNRIPTLINAQARRSWEPAFAGSISGKTLLVLGVGRLGSAGARAAKALGMKVIGVRRSGGAASHFDETHSTSSLRELLPIADFLLIAVPATRETDVMVGAAEIGAMKKGAGLINFSRARVCDYAALTKALESGELSGAVLDVFDQEPLPASSHLWTVPNLLITPHCSSDDAERYVPMTLDLVFSNVARLLAGEPLRNRVDLSTEY